MQLAVPTKHVIPECTCRGSPATIGRSPTSAFGDDELAGTAETQRGFTLIEVLIALAILSVALTAIIKITAQNIQYTAYLQDKTFAHWVGLQVMQEIQMGLLRPAELNNATHSTTLLSTTWIWQAYRSDTPNAHIKKNHVDVFREADQHKLVSLESYSYVG